jgi:hypothetical protein
MTADTAFHSDKQLMADLATLNEHVSRYLLRLLDADAGRAEPVSVPDERAFASSLQAMADRLQARADRHAKLDTPHAR